MFILTEIDTFLYVTSTGRSWAIRLSTTSYHLLLSFYFLLFFPYPFHPSTQSHRLLAVTLCSSNLSTFCKCQIFQSFFHLFNCHFLNLSFLFTFSLEFRRCLPAPPKFFTSFFSYTLLIIYVEEVKI